MEERELHSLRQKLKIEAENLKVINDFILDEGNPLVNSLMEIIEKHGGVQEVNRRAREAQRLEIRNLERISSAISGTKFKVKKVEEKKPRWKRFQDFIKIDIIKSDD